MAIALVTNGAAAGASTFTSGSFNTTGANLLVIVLTENTAGGTTISDSKSNTWTPLTEQSAVNPSCLILYAKNPTVGTGHTFTATGTSIFAVISMLAFSGCDTLSPFDQQNGTGGAGFVNTASPGSITPTVNNEVVVTGFAWNSATTITSVTGYTITNQTDFLGGSNFGGGAAYNVQTTASATNPAWNWTGTTAGDLVIASFKAGAAAASQVPYNTYYQQMLTQ